MIIPDCLILLFGIYWHYLVLSRTKEGPRIGASRHTGLRKLPKATTVGYAGNGQDGQPVSESAGVIDAADDDDARSATTESSPSADPRSREQVDDTNGADDEAEFDFINAPSQSLPWKLFLKRAWFLWSTRVMLCLIVLFACTSTSPDVFSAMYVAITKPTHAVAHSDLRVVSCLGRKRCIGVSLFSAQAF